jgi:hypothetical protein
MSPPEPDNYSVAGKTYRNTCPPAPDFSVVEWRRHNQRTMAASDLLRDIF